MTCDTCKWYGFYFVTEHPSIPRLNKRSFVNSCENPKVNAGLNRDDSANEDSGGKLKCGPKFGCVHHESK